MWLGSGSSGKMKSSMGLRPCLGALAAAALVTGCGGGGGSSSSGTEITTSTPRSPPGVYQTRVTFENDDGTTSTINGVSLLSSTGEYVTELSPPDSSFLDAAFGQLLFLGRLVEGEAINYFQVLGEWKTNKGKVSGTVDSGVINLTASSSGVSGSQIRMTRSAQESDQGFDLDALSDTYTVNSGGYVISLTLQTDGSLDGADINGCIFRGVPDDLEAGDGVNVPDPDYNVFKISFKAFDCSGAETIPSGVYRGLGSFDQDANELYFYSNNGEVGLLIRLVKGG